MALLVAVSKVVNSPIFDIHCKHWKFFYAIKNLWIPTGTGKALIIAWHFFQKVGKAYTSLHFEIPKWRDPPFQEFWARWLGGMKQTGFFGGFTHFVVPFFASRQSLCTWHGYFEKTSVLACLFWLVSSRDAYASKKKLHIVKKLSTPPPSFR